MNGDNEDNLNNSEIQKTEDLKEFLTKICEAMCLDAYESKPKDIPNFMIKYLQNKYGYSTSGLQYEEKKELEKLRNEVEIFRDMDEHAYYAELQKQAKKEVKVEQKKGKNPPKPKPQLPPDEIIVSDDEDYDNKDEIDDNLDNIEYIQNCNLNNRRIAVTENCVNDDEYQTPIKTFKKNNELIEFIRINLMRNPIFSELPINVLLQCINAMEEKNVPAVTDIVKQGEIGDTFFFIAEGEIECKIQFTKITKEGNRKKVEKFEPKLVKVYGPGDYFGELSLLYHTPRRGTLKAITDVKLYILNRITYKKIIKNAVDEAIIKRINILKKVPILQTLLDEELEKIESIAKEAIYYNGETIIKENEFSNVMFIIDKGKCIGTQTEEKGKIPAKTNDYREGDIIGESALLKGEKMQENIIANTDIVKLICLDRFSFKNNFGSLEQILMRNMDLYYTFFPPIQEEEKNENKEDDKQNEVKDNNNNNNIISLNFNNNNNNIANNNNVNNSNVNNNNVNVEEIKKKIMEEVEEEKKKMEMKHEEEIERLKQQLAYLQNQNEELTKQNFNIQNQNQQNNNINNNIDNQEINNNQQIQNEEQNNILNDNNDYQNNMALDNNEENNVAIKNDEENVNPINNNEENNIPIKNDEENADNNLDNNNQNEQENNEKMIISNNDISNINNIEQNQNPQEMNNGAEEEKNKNEEESNNTSKLELIRDKLIYKDNEIPIDTENQNEDEQNKENEDEQNKENEDEQNKENNQPNGFPMNKLEFNDNTEGNNDINTNNMNMNMNMNPDDAFNEDNQLNDGEF